MKSSRISLGLAALALLSGCGPKMGPPTRQYLVDTCGAISQLDAELAKEVLPTAPALPNLAGLSPQGEAQTLQDFSIELTKYYDEAQKIADHVVSLGDQALNKLGELSSADPTLIEPSAVELRDRYKALVNQRQQMAVDVQAVVAAQRSALRKGSVPRYALRLVIGGVESLCTPSDRIPAGVDPAASELKPAPDEKSEATGQNLSIQRAIASWRRNIADGAATREALAGTLKAKYKDLDWSFLAPAG